jgi:hypothetical protein
MRYLEEVLTDNPTLYWRFEETSGNFKHGSGLLFLGRVYPCQKATTPSRGDHLGIRSGV